MSATDELLAGLAQRGVKYTNIGDTTFWLDESGVKWCAQDWMHGELRLQAITLLTPEQAIAATLGPETCRIDYHFGEWYCTGCGEMVGTCDEASELRIDGNAIELWHFCPNCGRRVVREVVE